MPRLPIHPAILIVVYLAPLMALLYLIWNGVWPPSWLQWLASLTTLLWPIWFWQAVTFASAQPGQDQGRTRGRTVRANLLATGAGLGLAAGFILEGTIQPRLLAGGGLERFIGPLGDILGVVGVLLMLVLTGVAARAICEAEEAQDVRAPGVVVTFLLLLYLFIGAPFVYGRLKRLRDRSPEAARVVA